MRNCPFGSLAFRRTKEIGFIKDRGSPFGNVNVLRSVCSERSSVRQQVGTIKTSEDRLLGDVPLRSRVPCKETKKKTLSFRIGPPSRPPKTLRLRIGRFTLAAFKKGLFELS